MFMNQLLVGVKWAGVGITKEQEKMVQGRTKMPITTAGLSSMLAMAQACHDLK
jgi:hypothetical protein